MSSHSFRSYLLRKIVFFSIILLGSSIVCSTILFSIPLKYRMYNFYPQGEARFEPERYSYFVGVTLGYFDENNNTIPVFIRYLRWLGVVEKPVYGFWEDTGIPPYNTSGVFQGDLGNSWYWIGPGVWVGRNITDLFSEGYILHSVIFLLISLCVTLGISFLFLFFRKKRQKLLFFSEKRIRFHFNWLQKHFYIVFFGALVLDFSFSLSKWAGLSFFLYNSYFDFLDFPTFTSALFVYSFFALCFKLCYDVFLDFIIYIRTAPIIKKKTKHKVKRNYSLILE